MHSWGIQFFSLLGVGRKGDILFFMCSQCVPIMFKSGSPSSQVVLQDIPNVTSYLSHMVCQQFNSHEYKLKRWCVAEIKKIVLDDNPIDLGRSLTFTIFCYFQGEIYKHLEIKAQKNLKCIYFSKIIKKYNLKCSIYE
jgi:hypothetical protein